MAARGQLQIFLWAQKLQYRNVQVIFFKVLLKFKMAAMDKHIFLWAQKLKNCNQ